MQFPDHTGVQSNNDRKNQLLLQKFINEHHAELDHHSANNQRTVDRYNIVFPVKITIDGETRGGVSRDISTQGMGVITPCGFAPFQIAEIQLSSQDGPIAEFTAECRWSHEFGDQHCISGWRFLVE